MTRSRFRTLTEQASTIAARCEALTSAETVQLTETTADSNIVYTTLGKGEIVGSSVDSDGDTLLTVRHPNGQTRNYYGAECA